MGSTRSWILFAGLASIAFACAMLSGTSNTSVVSGAFAQDKSGSGKSEFDGRVLDKNNLVASGGGSVETETAVLNALKWLARHQGKDGKWDCDEFNKLCGDPKCTGEGYAENDIGVTGLALLAFLGAGYRHISRDVHDGICFGDVVKNGLKFLVERQDKDGCFGPQAGKFMYNHCIATFALAEAYGMTESKLFEFPAQKGIDFIIIAQNPARAWRYQIKPGDNDTSVTGWAVSALKAGQTAGLNVPDGGFKGAMNWIEGVTGETDYSVGYTAKGTGKVFVMGMNENWAGHETMTAVGMLCRIAIRKDREDPVLEGGAKLLAKDLPVYDEMKQADNPTDYYYWYYGTQALFQYDGPSGRYWKNWNESLKKALLISQKKASSGCLAGSWGSEEDRWGFDGGRVYATAINTLTLETYYRYPNAFAGADKKKDAGK